VVSPPENGFAIDVAGAPRGARVVAVAGELDLYTAPQLRAALDSELERGFTDGLVEARSGRRVVDDAEVEAALAGSAGLPAAEILARVEADLARLGGVPQDDLAIVVARHTA
jgi:Stage II sporulation protein E (SpoIIE)